MLALLVLASGAWGLAGCERVDEAERKLVAAKARMTAIAGREEPAPTATRAKAYQEVIQSMQSITEEGVGKGAAQLVIAQATMGQGEIEATRQGEAETEVAQLLSRTRVLAELYVSQRSLAESQEGHDLSAGLGEIDRQIKGFEAKSAEVKARLGELEAALGKITAAAGEQGGLAKAARQQAGQLRASMNDAPGEARLKIAEEAAKRQREADKFEVQQSGIELEARALERKLEETRRDADLLARQVELSRAARARLVDSEKLLKDQSATARADAEKAATELAASYEMLKKAVSEQLTPAYQSAVGKYNAAGAAAGQGGKADQGLSKAISGSAQQALGTIHASYGAALDNCSVLAARIGACKGLANAASYQQDATAFAELAKPAREAADSAFAQAGANFQSAGGKGTAAEMFKKLGEKLSPLPESKNEPKDAGAPGEVKPAGEAPKADTSPAETEKQAEQPAGNQPKPEEPKPGEPASNAPQPSEPPAPAAPPAGGGNEPK